MKRLLLSLSLIGSFVSASPALAYNVNHHDAKTNLYERIVDGSIDKDLRRVHTGIGPNGGIIFYEIPYLANRHEVTVRYRGQYECFNRLDLGKCLPEKKLR